jgi:glucokinase
VAAVERDGDPIVLGVDVGGTKTLAHAFGGRGETESIASWRSEGPADAAALLGLIESSVEDLAADPNEAVGLAAIGIGLAGWIDGEGVARRSPHVGDLVGVDLAAVVRRRFGVPVRVENDGNCTAVAALHSCETPPTSLLAVTLGTGIGAGLVLRGSLERGAHGYAGEPGHMVLEPDGPPCPCGQSGCWERYASGPGIARAAASAVQRGELDPADVGGTAAPNAEAVVSAAREGSAAARAVMEEFAAWVARGIAAVVNVVDPEVVALGGGLSAAADTWLPGVRRRLDANPTFAFRGTRVEVVRAAERAGAVGASLLARSELAGAP